MSLGDLPAGSLVTHVAIERIGPERIAIVLDISATGSGGDPVSGSCELIWEGGEELDRWRACKLSVPRKVRGAQLRVRYSAGVNTDAWVASPIMIPERSALGPPVFVIMMDTARLDAFDPGERFLGLASGFARLAEDAILFEHLRASSSWTRTSVATLLTGLSPSGHDVFGRLSLLPADVPALQSELQQHGYVTAAWSSNPNVLPMWGFARGFDAFVDVGALEWTKAKADAIEVFGVVREAIRAREAAPIFHYIHLMDPHAPYVPSEEHLTAVRELGVAADTFPGRGPDDLEDTVREDYAKYLAEVVDLDEQLEAFVDFLKAEDLYESALILVVSDHGEEFLDHGGRHHGRTLYEEMLRVPGIMKLPSNVRGGEVMEEPVGLIDLMPTVLDALGIAPPGGVEGVSLLSGQWRPRPHVSALSLDGRHLAGVAYDGWKLISDYVGGEEMLFELASDPHESRNRFSDSAGMADTLRFILDTGAVRQPPGWHVRVCGCPVRSEFEFMALTGGAEVVGAMLEDEDVLTAQEGGTFTMQSVLRPSRAQREVFGRLQPVVVPDQDELVITGQPDASLTITGTDSQQITYALGRDKQRSTSDRLVFEGPTAATTVSAREPLACSDSAFVPAIQLMKADREPCEPYVRVWFVPSARVMAEEEVDPAVVERLKALGYTW